MTTATATVTKTSQVTWILAASHSITLIPSRSIRQMLVTFFWSSILKDCIEVQEKKKKVVVLCSRPSQNVGAWHRSRTVKWRQRNVKLNRAMHVQSYCFANQTYCYFSVLFAGRPGSLSFLSPVVQRQGTKNSTKHSVLVIRQALKFTTHWCQDNSGLKLRRTPVMCWRTLLTIK